MRTILKHKILDEIAIKVTINIIKLAGLLIMFKIFFQISPFKTRERTSK